ncbi:hypothetical protein N7539_006269 [Penicillium diatomitis]|uniref:Uncharacterized protein n=1 Tax=Penicillium diatomitis TaxID=2819901 RepID=A0A9W9X2T0_9EURO|nr:uncharacterized protein N7539_006269 [Penicillium diatomitis]KAJ5482823.1 hypothetical protein N7539_006269 [Penicillium diatomitis]
MQPTMAHVPMAGVVDNEQMMVFVAVHSPVVKCLVNLSAQDLSWEISISDAVTTSCFTKGLKRS